MPLKFPGSWRFSRGGAESVPTRAVRAFEDLIYRVVAQAEKRWDLIEYFKRYFAEAVGSIPGNSSSESWAETDLRAYMDDASKYPALFLEAVYDAFDSLRAKYDVPDVETLNEICRECELPYAIQPPNLIRLGGSQVAVPAPAPPASLAEEASNTFNESVRRAGELLSANHPREAVQEMLWILESIATVFIGIPALSGGNIKGKYFNEIAKELKKIGSGTTLERAIEWCTQLHGYLSSPTGGGVRHGANLLTKTTPITHDEGRFFVNLIMSYVSFLLAEHRRLKP